MHLQKINLVNFKNYNEAEFSFSNEINCFIGNNGVGKTNLLDAVYYLSMCKSYLNPVDSQNISFDENFFLIQGEWFKEDKEHNIYCGVKRGVKKVFKKNKVEYEKLADHIGQFPVVVISPYDRNLISEGSDVRRKWMDGIISQFDRHYLDSLIRYGKVLDQRNALLKKMGDFGFFDAESIEVWDDQLVRYGAELHEKRKNFLADFIPVFQKYYSLVSNQNESVNLSYKSQLEEGNFAQLLIESRRNDERKRYSTVGTHKDDLVFEIKDHPIKKFGSQGQQKSFLIALRLAQFDWLKTHLGTKPVLLLDDIFDKLDNTRVEQLMNLVSKHEFGQVFVTDTDLKRVRDIFADIDANIKMFTITPTEIEEINSVKTITS